MPEDRGLTPISWLTLYILPFSSASRRLRIPSCDDRVSGTKESVFIDGFGVRGIHGLVHCLVDCPVPGRPVPGSWIEGLNRGLDRGLVAQLVRARA